MELGSSFVPNREQPEPCLAARQQTRRLIVLDAPKGLHGEDGLGSGSSEHSYSRLASAAFALREWGERVFDAT
jgi:hypothetical protein